MIHSREFAYRQTDYLQIFSKNIMHLRYPLCVVICLILSGTVATESNTLEDQMLWSVVDRLDKEVTELKNILWGVLELLDSPRESEVIGDFRQKYRSPRSIVVEKQHFEFIEAIKAHDAWMEACYMKLEELLKDNPGTLAECDYSSRKVIIKTFEDLNALSVQSNYNQLDDPEKIAKLGNSYDFVGLMVDDDS